MSTGDSKSTKDTVVAALITGSCAVAAAVIGTVSSQPAGRNASLTPENSITSQVAGPPTANAEALKALAGNWHMEGEKGPAYLTISDTGSYRYVDTTDTTRNEEGQLTIDGSTLTFHSITLGKATYAWSIERTPVGEVLHIGITAYSRQ